MIGRRVTVTGNRFHPVIPEGSVWIGREAPYRKRSPFHNPFTVAEHGRERAVELYRIYLGLWPEIVEQACRELSGLDVACICKPDEQCHGDVLIEAVAALIARTAEALLVAV